MKADEPPPAVGEQFSSLLAAFDERVAAGARVDTSRDSETTDPELRRRLEQGMECVRLLEQKWPRSTAPTAALATSGTSQAIPADHSPEEMPRRIGRFEVQRELGRGGCGVVFLAFDPKLHRDVALKVPHPGALLSGEMRNRFVREAWAAAGLNHPNIVAVYEAGDAGPVSYIASAYCPGPTLAGWLKGRQEPVPFRLAAMLVATLADALEHAHGRGVLHRDLKPSNVLLDTAECGAQRAESRNDAAEGRGQSAESQNDKNAGASGAGLGLRSSLSALSPKVTDFGLAKLLDEEIGDTKTGVLMGTASYMAPEQATGRTAEIGRAVDIYALGAILYELLTGRPPFQGDSALDILQQVGHAEPVPPHRLRGKVPRDLETICLKCLEKEPRRRYPDASGLAADLRRFLAGEPITARPVSAAERLWRWCRRNPGLASMAASITTLLLLVTVVSSFAALRLREHQAATQRNLERALRAETDGLRKLWDAHIAEAQAVRQSGHEGQRFRGLEAVAAAARLAARLDLGENERLRLRNEAVACMALVDLRVDRTRQGYPPGGSGQGIIFDSDVERYARIDTDGHLVVRRLDNDEELVRFPFVANLEHPPQLCFSPDGRFLAAKRNENGLFPIQVWDLTTRAITLETLGVWGTHQADLTFSPDSQLLATCNPAGSICLYDVCSGKEVKRLATGPVPASFRFHPDGDKLAIWRNSQVQIVEWHSGQVIQTLPKRCSSSILAWSADGLSLATIDNLNGQIWDFETSQEPTILEGHQSGVLRVSFSHDGKLAATIGYDGTTRLWDPNTGTQLMNCLGYGIDFSRDDRWLGIGYMGHVVGRWEVANGRERRTFHEREPRDIGAITLSPDGRLMASTHPNGVQLWDWAATKSVTLLPLKSPSYAVFDEASGDLFTSGPSGLDRWPVRFNRETGRSRLVVGPPQSIGPQPMPGHHPLALSSDGRTIAVRTSDARAAVFDQESGFETARLIQHTGMNHPAISPDGNWVVTTPWQGKGIKVWATGTGELICDLLPESRIGTAVFSPDGRWLATGTAEEYRFWHVGSWEFSHRIPRENVGGVPGTVAFSRDSVVAAISHSSWAVKIVDPATGKELLTLPSRRLHPWLGFSPDGSQLAMPSVNGSIDVWDLQLVREQLAEMGLDWAQSPYPHHADIEAIEPIRVDVQFGDRVELYYELAQHARLRKKFDDAIANYSKCVQLKPDHDAACNNLAWVYACWPSETRRPEEALRFALKAVELAPENAYYRNTLGVVYYRLGKFDEAVKTLEKAVDRETDDRTAFDFFFLAMSYFQLGEPQQAQDCYARAMRWWSGQSQLPPQWTEELQIFRAEADSLLAGAPRARQ